MTTRLGFGCAYLLPESAALLDVAYDAGIRHFDVARAYGRGLTEGVLGRFLSRRGTDVTVTTKYGIQPPVSHPAFQVLRSILRPVVKVVRKSKTLNQQVSDSISSMYAPARFDAKEMTSSLELSMRRLRLEHIDIFLMHEASASSLKDPGLLLALNELVQRGRIGCFGVGGQSSRVPDLLVEAPAYCRVLQHEWVANEVLMEAPQSFRIFYRTFGGRAAAANASLMSDREICRDWSDRVGEDLSLPGMFQQLMLKAAYDFSPNSMVLFSSTNPRNIVKNIEAVNDSTLSAPALRLADIVGSMSDR